MRSFGLRDVLGPIMVGPSSSHTAGALRIAQMARQLLDAPPMEAEFTLYGSFARTYRGHGTDRALVAGMLGMHTDDLRIRDSLQIARERGLRFGIAVDPKTRVSHPNTVDVRVRDANGDEIVARGESVGGGAARLTMIDGHGVQITGEYNALILYERDVPGVLGHIASTLGAGGVNIGSVWMYRSRRGGEAFNVLEVDGPVPPDVRRAILASPDVLRMRFVSADGLSSPRGQEGLGAPSMDAGEAERALPEVDFEDAAGMLAYADERGLTLGQAFMRREEVCEAMHGRPLAAAERYLDDALRVMRDSVRGPLGGDVRTMGGLIGGESRALARLAGRGGALAGGVDARERAACDGRARDERVHGAHRRRADGRVVGRGARRGPGPGRGREVRGRAAEGRPCVRRGRGLRGEPQRDRRGRGGRLPGGGGHGERHGRRRGDAASRRGSPDVP